MTVRPLLLALTVASLLLPAAASAAVPMSGGACEGAYRYCMADPRFPDKQTCENNWRYCVKNKCKPISKKTGQTTAKQCPADRDCEYSCTEYVKSSEGLKDCCLGTPLHDKKCKKRVDNICNPSKPDSFVAGAGPAYAEGDKIPSGWKLRYGVDSQILQSLPEVGQGMPIIPPRAYPPDPIAQVPGYYAPLPPEYLPERPYQQMQADNRFIEALAFNKDTYVSSYNAVPPGGPDYTLGSNYDLRSGVTSLSSGNFDPAYPAVSPALVSRQGDEYQTAPATPPETFASPGTAEQANPESPSTPESQQQPPPRTLWGWFKSLWGF